MKKVLFINAIVSALFFVVTILLPADTLIWTGRLTSSYMGYSVGMFLLSLCVVYDRKNITPRKQLQVIAVLVIFFDALFSVCAVALLIEWLHAGPFGVLGYLFVNGVCLLVFSIKNRKQREALTE